MLACWPLMYMHYGAGNISPTYGNDIGSQQSTLDQIQTACTLRAMSCRSVIVTFFKIATAGLEVGFFLASSHTSEDATEFCDSLHGIATTAGPYLHTSRSRGGTSAWTTHQSQGCSLTSS